LESNVEVIDVPASELTPGDTYPLLVRVWDVKIPANDFFYYSVGWTWVKDHAD
jgi:hypothetical protein